MPTYIGENKIVDRYLGDKFLEAAYIGDEKVYDPYTEITGYLPLIFKSRANVALKNYRIHGTSMGAGVETENLIFKTLLGANIDPTGYVVQHEQFNLHIAKIVKDKQYVSAKGDVYAFYESEPLYYSQSYNQERVIAPPIFTAPITGFIAYRTLASVTEAMLTEGSTPPETYIPPGYKLPLTVESGVTENILDCSTFSAGFISGEGIIESPEDVSSLSTTSSSFTVTTTKNWRGIHCDMMDVPEGAESFCFRFNGLNTDGVWRIAFYDSNSVFVSAETTSGTYTRIILIPASAKKVAIGVTFPTAGTWVRSGLMLAESDTIINYIPHRYTSDIPIYIGSSKLGEEEYVDFGEQKVYKRTENLFDKDAKDTNKGYVARKYLGSDGSYQEGYSSWSISEYIDVEPNVKYQYKYNSGYNEIYLCLYDENKQFISSIKYGNFGYTITFTTTAYTKFVRVSILNSKVNETQFIKSNSAPTSYTPYYDIQTPPAPLPPIPTYKGENTLSSTETLGEVTVKGRIRELNYRRVEYLKSTGTQIIITDIIGSSANRYELDLKFGLANADSKRGFFGTIETSNGAVVTRLNGNWGTSNDQNLGVYFFESTNASMKDLGSPTYRTNRNTFVMSSTSASYGAVSWTPPAMTLGDLSLPLALFGVIEGNSTSEFKPFAQSDMWLYGCVVKNANGDKIHDLRPVEREDGELGLLDIITNKFYTNAGTGTFEKGEYI